MRGALLLTENGFDLEQSVVLPVFVSQIEKGLNIGCFQHESSSHKPVYKL